MHKYFLFTLLTILVSCKNSEKQQHSPSESLEDNDVLTKIYEEDQADRQDVTNWRDVSYRDSVRRIMVQNLLDADKLKTSNDYRYAAMIFQHGEDSTDYEKAVLFMKKAVALDPDSSKWLLAAATDRYLLSIGKPQIYGTQYHRNRGEPWRLADMDTTKITDEERKEFGVRTLAEQRKKVKEMNGEEDN